jgi:hypothetical protein
MHENGGGRHGSEEAGARRKAMIAAIAGPAAKMIVWRLWRTGVPAEREMNSYPMRIERRVPLKVQSQLERAASLISEIYSIFIYFLKETAHKKCGEKRSFREGQKGSRCGKLPKL